MEPAPSVSITHSFVTLSDGTKLALRAWIPNIAYQRPQPVVLEAKSFDTFTHLPDEETAIIRQLREHHLTFVQVDMRGCGQSDGILRGENFSQENEDLLEVIAWLNTQPWCNKHIGLFGKGLGGYLALQIASRNLPTIKAVITVSTPSDRYEDGAIYDNGNLLAANALSKASALLAWSALPPLPRFREDWQTVWNHRLEHIQAKLPIWLTHQRKDLYWMQRSLGDFTSIRCPVLLMGSWEDETVASIPRLLDKLYCPKKAVLFSSFDDPTTPMIVIQECLSWFEYWLHGRQQQLVPKEALLKAAVSTANRSGHHTAFWVEEQAWPPASQHLSTFYLNWRTIDSLPRESVSLPLASAQTFKLTDMQFRHKTRLGTQESLDWQTVPLHQPMLILGTPTLAIETVCEPGNVDLHALLIDVDPLGNESIISHGSATPVDIREPASRHMKISFKPTGYSLSKGHRLKVSIASSDWPRVWPSPNTHPISVITGSSAILQLPQVEPTFVRHVEPPDVPIVKTARLTDTLFSHVLRRQMNIRQSGRQTIQEVSTQETPAKQNDHLHHFETHTGLYSIHARKAASANGYGFHTIKLQDTDWLVEIQAKVHLYSTNNQFHTVNQLSVSHNKKLVFGKKWLKSIDRIIR